MPHHDGNVSYSVRRKRILLANVYRTGKTDEVKGSDMEQELFGWK